MAKEAILAAQAAANPLIISSVSSIEEAAADLCVAGVFLDAAEDFAEKVLIWAGENGISPSPPIGAEISRARTMIDEARDRLGAARSKIDAFVDEAFGTRRPDGEC